MTWKILNTILLNYGSSAKYDEFKSEEAYMKAYIANMQLAYPNNLSFLSTFLSPILQKQQSNRLSLFQNLEALIIAYWK